MQMIENSEGLRHEFTVTLPAETITTRVNTRLAEIGKTARLPGFRPGKVPMVLMRKRYGPSVRAEIITTSVQESTAQLLKERSLRPAQEPEVRITAGSGNGQEDLSFTVTFDALPQIPAIDFGSLSLERLTVEVDDQSLGRAMDQLLAASPRAPEPVTEDRPSQSGDIMILTLDGTIEGEGGSVLTGERVSLELGQNRFVPGFDEAMLGARVGETRTFTFVMPETLPDPLADRSAVFAGRAVAFTANVTALQDVKAMPSAETLAKTYGAENIESMQNTVRQLLEGEYALQSRERLKRLLLDRLAATCVFDVPPGMLEMESAALWQQVMDAKAKGELEPEEMTRDEETLKAEYRAVAERRIRLGLILAEIGRTNTITLTPGDIEQALRVGTRRVPHALKARMVAYYCKTPHMFNAVKATALEDKIVDFILARAAVTERVVTAEELARDDVGDSEKGEETAPLDGAELGAAPQDG
ncbi:MAG: trigger factor [Rhodospirillaceae bacterium]|nr:MAG: trigger factor [Rhodospirillaceae bacterium]